MKVVDVNLLLYAVNADSPHHQSAQRWWSEQLNGDDTISLPWTVILGFLRLSTRSGVFAVPLAPEVACGLVADWLRQPVVQVANPGPRHWEILQSLITRAGTAGNLTTDAHLAAVAIEYGAELCSTDYDFARFVPDLRFRNPLQ
jgi:uncharacterized protein